MADAARNKTTVLSLLDKVWTQGDLTAIDSLVAPRYTIFHDPGDPWDGQILDRPGYRERVRQSRSPFPDQKFEVQHLVVEGHNVAVAWTWQGTHQGPVAGFSASGRLITMSGLTLYTCEDGLLNGHWQCADRLGVYMQLQQSGRPER